MDNRLQVQLKESRRTSVSFVFASSICLIKYQLFLLLTKFALLLLHGTFQCSYRPNISPLRLLIRIRQDIVIITYVCKVRVPQALFKQILQKTLSQNCEVELLKSLFIPLLQGFK